MTLEAFLQSINAFNILKWLFTEPFLFMNRRKGLAVEVGASERKRRTTSTSSRRRSCPSGPEAF